MNKLGFGFLRLPAAEGAEGEIDLSALNPMVDAFLAGGGRYFDTAYTYLGGKSEWAIREAVAKRHPRESFLLADKLPGYNMRSLSDCEACFEEQLKRCGVEYFDVYMLHWLNGENYAAAERVDEFAFLRRLKAEGRARKTGFSYHDSAALLEEILTRHPEVDYVQLQINYLDWDSEAIQARECYETAVKHGKKVVVMEPVKGGALASPPAEAAALLRTLNPAGDFASLALRFAADLPAVEVVLSGMGTLAQVEDNLRPWPPLTDREREVLNRAAAVIRENTAIPCTGCGYCRDHCPQRIPIPNYFRLFNEYSRDPAEGWKIRPVYEQLAAGHGRASDCEACGACGEHCPQKLPAPELMKKVKTVFDP